MRRFLGHVPCELCGRHPLCQMGNSIMMSTSKGSFTWIQVFISILISSIFNIVCLELLFERHRNSNLPVGLQISRGPFLWIEKLNISRELGLLSNVWSSQFGDVYIKWFMDYNWTSHTLLILLCTSECVKYERSHTQQYCKSGHAQRM